jgi:hypothetical protein
MSPERVIIQMLKEKKIFKNSPKNVNAKKLLEMAKKYSNKNIYNQVQKLCIS